MLNVPVQHIEIINGQAFVARQRVKVKMIVNMHLRGGAPIEDVIEQYDLTEAEIYAALTYYYDNKAAFDRQYEEDQALLKQLGLSADEHSPAIPCSVRRRARPVPAAWLSRILFHGLYMTRANMLCVYKLLQ